MQIGLSLSPSASVFGPLCFAGRLEEGMQAVHSLGYDGVEVSLRTAEQIACDAFRKTLERLNLRLFAIATGQTYYTDGYSLWAAQPEKRRLAIKRLYDHIDLAAELGCMVIIGGIRGKIETSDPQEVSQILASGQEALVMCVEHAEKKDVTLQLEPINRYETNIVNTLAEGAGLVGTIGSARLKLLPDTFHMNIEEASLVESLREALPVIGYIHFADSNRLAPGLGHIDFKAIVALLREGGYQGRVGVEVLPKPNDFAAAEQALRYCRGL